MAIINNNKYAVNITYSFLGSVLLTNDIDEDLRPVMALFNHQHKPTRLWQRFSSILSVKVHGSNRAFTLLDRHDASATSTIKQPDRWQSKTFPSRCHQQKVFFVSDCRWMASKSARSSNPADVSKEYQKKSQREHVLLRPDVYVGSLEAREDELPIYDEKSRTIQIRKVTYVPGLLKVFDEILVNAADNFQRDDSMTHIHVSFNAKGNITISNDGRGIPVVMHERHEIYIPELVMGHLLAGSNFDDSKERLAGGRHGYGAKLTNIFSKQFTVETGDSQNGLEYKQTWHDNMQVCDAPIVTPSPGCKDYTRITFHLDLQRFGVKNAVDNDTLSLWARRVADISACNPKISCMLNKKAVKITLKDMASALTEHMLRQRRPAIIDEDRLSRLSEYVTLQDRAGRWHCIVGARPGKVSRDAWSFSFVNNTCTHRGGTHVRHVSDQIVEFVMKQIKKDHKLNVKEKDVRSCLQIIICAFIVNPSFDSQVRNLI